MDLHTYPPNTALHSQAKNFIFSTEDEEDEIHDGKFSFAYLCSALGLNRKSLQDAIELDFKSRDLLEPPPVVISEKKEVSRVRAATKI